MKGKKQLTTKAPPPENRVHLAHIDVRLTALVQLMARTAAAEDYAKWQANNARAKKQEGKEQ